MKDKLWLLSIRLKNLLASEDGQDLVEYALIVAMIAFAATTSISTLATTINNVFKNIGNSLANNAG